VGAPEPVADSLVKYFTAVKDGRISTSSTFAELMGRPPRRFGEWVRDNLDALKAQVPSATR
jgi:hypothetical protein